MLSLIAPEEKLSSSRLVLEPLLESHAEPLFAVLADDRVYKHLDEKKPTSAAAVAIRYKRLESRRSADGEQLWLNWAVRRLSPDAYIGAIQATVHATGSAELAYMLGPEFWGAGYAAEACRRVLSLLFDEYRVSAVFARFDTRNWASADLVERLGFTPATEQDRTEHELPVPKRDESLFFMKTAT